KLASANSTSETHTDARRSRFLKRSATRIIREDSSWRHNSVSPACKSPETHTKHIWPSPCPTVWRYDPENDEDVRGRRTVPAAERSCFAGKRPHRELRQFTNQLQPQ